jgi:hypothetical protein
MQSGEFGSYAEYVFERSPGNASVSNGQQGQTAECISNRPRGVFGRDGDGGDDTVEKGAEAFARFTAEPDVANGPGANETDGKGNRMRAAPISLEITIKPIWIQ